MLDTTRLRILAIAGMVCALGLMGSVGTSHARDATVVVDVVEGRRGASGVDDSAKKHERLLTRVGGYGAWRLTHSLRLQVAPGKTAEQRAGKRSFRATLHEISSDKARTTFVVIDANGKSHKVTSRLANGASTAMTVESADGKTVQVFIIRIRY